MIQMQKNSFLVTPVKIFSVYDAKQTKFSGPQI